MSSRRMDPAVILDLDERIEPFLGGPPDTITGLVLGVATYPSWTTYTGALAERDRIGCLFETDDGILQAASSRPQRRPVGAAGRPDR